MPEYRTTCQILSLIRRLERCHRHELPINRLAEELGVHRRTVVRWVIALQGEWLDEDGNPHVERFQRNGETWARLNASTTNLTGSVFQYSSLIGALKTLDALRGTVLVDGAWDLVDRIESALPKSCHATLDEVQRRVTATSVTQRNAIDEDVADAVLSSVIRGRALTVQARTSSGAAVERELHPWALVFHESHPYLLAQLAEAERMACLPLSDLLTADVIRGSKPERPQDADLLDLFWRWKDVPIDNAKLEPVVLAVAAERFDQADWPGVRCWSPMPDGRLRLHLEVPASDALVERILARGAEVEVLMPLALRGRVRQALIDNLIRYALTEVSEPERTTAVRPMGLVQA